jgi:sugar lactone lactonase YvrE
MLSNMTEFVKRGEYSNVVGNKGNVYLAEGQILVLDNDGNELKRITLDERVHSMDWGGKNKDELFVTTSTSFYRVKL